MASIRDQIKESIAEASNSSCSKEDQLKAEEIMVKIIEKGMLPKDAIGLNQQFLDELYDKGNSYFKSGNFQKSIDIYRLLMILNPQEPSYPMAIAASYHQLKKYFEALNFYALASSLDFQNPLPYYHAADCLEKCGNEDSALLMLEVALKKLSIYPNQTILKERIENSIIALKNRIKGAFV